MSRELLLLIRRIVDKKTMFHIYAVLWVYYNI